jgi:hypothetical protein
MIEVQFRNSAGVIGRMSADNPEDAARAAVALIEDAGMLFDGDSIRVIDTKEQSEG